MVAPGSPEKCCPVRWLHVHQVPRNKLAGYFWILNTIVISCNITLNIPEVESVTDTGACKPQEGPQARPERRHCLPNVAVAGGRGSVGRRLRHQQEGAGHSRKGRR